MEDLTTILEALKTQSTRDREGIERAVASLRAAATAVGEALRALTEVLTPSTDRPGRKPRVSGNGFTGADVEEIVKKARSERPNISRPELKELLAERARALGRSTTGLGLLLSKVLPKTESGDGDHKDD